MPRASQAEPMLGRWWSQVFPHSGRERQRAATARTVFEELLDRHREAHRQYHTAAHVQWVLRHIDELSRSITVTDRPALLAAAFFHDAIYDPRAHQPGANELASAELARRQLGELGWPHRRVQHVHAMIVATATHLLPSGHEPASDAALRTDLAVLLDADLAVLGADTAGYRAYVNGVRAEYRHVDSAGWLAGRTAVLDDLLARDSIYATDAGRDRWEARARANLTAERASLTT